MAETLYWYDLETFGRNPYWDRIAQFAGVRTNDQFEVVEEPLVLYCRISPDYLPDPGACMITGITPQDTLKKGVIEEKFAASIQEQFSRPGTCVTGYNSIRFDDEFIRNLFYKTLRDPYEREYAAGNSRWDIIDLVRVAHDLRPAGIIWPKGKEGRPSFRLEELTKANGIGHANAHDALSDVYATIEAAKLIHDKQPKLFSWVYHHRSRKTIQPLLKIHEKEPVLYTSRVLTTERGCTSIVAPLAVDPSNQRNGVIVCDLAKDPEPLLQLPAEHIRALLFKPADQRAPGEPEIPLINIAMNKSPVICPLQVLDKESEKRLGIDREQCLQNRQKLLQDPLFGQKIAQVFAASSMKEPDDPELQIYSGGFFPDQDKENFNRVHDLDPSTLKSTNFNFTDRRAKDLLWRFIRRNWPELLNESELKEWQSFCSGRVFMPPTPDACSMGEFEKRLQNLRQDNTLSAMQKKTVADLSSYGAKLKERLLAYR